MRHHGEQRRADSVPGTRTDAPPLRTCGRYPGDGSHHWAAHRDAGAGGNTPHRPRAPTIRGSNANSSPGVGKT
ncbi:unnamed protein product, partial [Lampetra planeri]